MPFNYYKLKNFKPDYLNNLKLGISVLIFYINYILSLIRNATDIGLSLLGMLVKCLQRFYNDNFIIFIYLNF